MPLRDTDAVLRVAALVWLWAVVEFRPQPLRVLPWARPVQPEPEVHPTHSVVLRLWLPLALLLDRHPPLGVER